MSREDHQMRIRLPPDIKDGVQAMASANRRSMNAEIISALAHVLNGSNKTPSNSPPSSLKGNLENLAERVARLESAVGLI